MAKFAKGDRVGPFRLIEPKRIGERSYWVVKCDLCKKTMTLRSDKVRAYKSCGCRKNENKSISLMKHGGSSNKDFPEYKTWCSMKERCNNPNHKSYSNYGGRGIKVCDRWQKSFQAFLADMGPRPVSKLDSSRQRAYYSLERVNVNEGYNPENCVWATAHDQAQNRRPFKRKNNGKSKKLSRTR